MNLAQHILHFIFPRDDDQRKCLMHAMEMNARETELLTDEIRRTSFSPDTTQKLFIKVNGSHKT